MKHWLFKAKAEKVTFKVLERNKHALRRGYVVHERFGGRDAMFVWRMYCGDIFEVSAFFFSKEVAEQVANCYNENIHYRGYQICPSFCVDKRGQEKFLTIAFHKGHWLKTDKLVDSIEKIKVVIDKQIESQNGV